jgi:PAS domain-containing protein
METLLTDLEIEKDLDHLIEAEIAEEYSNINEILGDAPVNLVIYNTDGSIEYASESFSNMLNYKAEILYGKNILEILPGIIAVSSKIEQGNGLNPQSILQKAIDSTGKLLDVTVYTSVLKELGAVRFLSILIPT